MKQAMREQMNAQKYLDIAGVIFVVISVEQKVTLINKRGCEVLNYPEEEIIGKNWFDNFIPQGKRDEVRKIFSNLMAGVIEPNEYTENYVLTKSGEERIIAWHNTILTDDSGVIIETLSSGEDITERKCAEEALYESEERFRSVVDTATDAIVSIDRKGEIVSWNKAAEHIYGYTYDEVVGKPFEIMVPEKLRATQRNSFNRLVSTGKGKVTGGTVESIGLKKDRSEFAVETSTSMLETKKGMLFTAIMRDITERKRMEEEIRALSLTDALTGLYNRRGLSTLSDQQLKIAARLKSEILVIFADLDGMKWINDNLGHLAGDQALIETATILKNTFRKSDIIARLGGDEFVVLAFGANDASSDILIKRVQEQISSLNAQENRSFKLSMSIGTALYDPRSPYPVDELILQADKTMYKHKQDKRGFSI